jgi:hypothetical protein
MNAPTSTTRSEVDAALVAVQALAQIIQPAPIPSGHLYARVCGAMTLEAYTGAIGLLKRAGLVAEKGHVLTWTGPDLK